MPLTIPSETSTLGGARRSVSCFPVVLALILGLSSFVLFSAGPPIAQAVLGSPGTVMSPLAHFDQVPSDEYYSYEILAQVIHSGTLPLTEQQAYEVLPSWENKRFATLSLSALMSLYLSDMRLALLAFLIVTGALYFALPMAIAHLLTGRALAGLIPALAFMIWPDIWTETGRDVEKLLASGQLGAWLNAWSHAASKTMYFLQELRKPEYLAQTFRLPYPGIPFLLLLAHFGAGMLLFRKVQWFAVTALMTTSLILLYAYQPATIVACIMLASFFVVATALRSLPQMASFGAIGAAILLFLAVSGYVPSMIADIQVHSVGNALTNLGDSQTPFDLAALSRIEPADLLVVIFNRYTVSGIVCLLLVWPNLLLRNGVFVLLVTCIIIKLVGASQLLPAAYAGRLERRAIDPIWLFILVLCLWAGWNRLMLGIARGGTLRTFLQAIGAVVVVAMYAFPVISFLGFSVRSAGTDTYSTPVAQWELLRWAKAHIGKDDVAVPQSWLDLFYLRIFSGSDTAYASIMNTGLSAQTEMNRYINAAKALGTDIARLRETVAFSHDASEAFYGRYTDYLTRRGDIIQPVHFGGTSQEFEAEKLYNAILRPAWFPQMYGVDVLNEEDEISSAYLQRVTEVYEASDGLASLAKDYQNAFLVYRKGTDSELNTGCDTVFANTVYMVKQCRFSGSPADNMAGTPTD